MSSSPGYNNPLFYSHKELIDDGECFEYWLASPSAYLSHVVFYVQWEGSVYASIYYAGSYGVRLVVMLKSEVLGTKVNGVWELSTN